MIREHITYARTSKWTITETTYTQRLAAFLPVAACCGFTELYRAMTSEPLRVLHLTESDHHSRELQEQLQRPGMTIVVTPVLSKTHFIRALCEPADIVLVDPKAEQAEAFDAVRMTHELHPNLPVVYFADAMGEEWAADALHRGAADLVFRRNSDRLLRIIIRINSTSRAGKGLFVADDKNNNGAAANSAFRIINGAESYSFSQQPHRVQELNNVGQASPDDEKHKEQSTTQGMQDQEQDQVQLFQQLYLSERLTSISTLAAGLGHDMGNLLLPLRIRLDSMEMRGIPPQFAEDMNAVRTCADHLQRVANGLRLLAADPATITSTNEQTDLNEWWDDAQMILKNGVPRGVSLERKFDRDLPLVRIGRQGLTQAIFNLVQNAGDALRSRDRGSVTVWAKADAPRSSVRIGITDTGTGMSARTLRQCFDPFFTTKTRGLSTGLGLPLVRSIVQQVGGSIHVESTSDAGTTIVMTLPAAPERLIQPRSSHNNANAATHPVAVVRVADERMRAFITWVLRSMRWDVSYNHSHNHIHNSADVRLMVIDAHDAALAEAKTFTAAGPHRRVVALGPTTTINPRQSSATRILPNRRCCVMYCSA